MSNSVYVSCVLYICPPAGCRRDRERESERKNHLSRGKETLVAQLWHRCSKVLYRLLTHTNRHLHKASCSASVAFRDAIVNCLPSLLNQSFCPSTPLLIPTSSCSVASPLRPPASPTLLIFHRIPPTTFLDLSYDHYHSLAILPWVTDMLIKMPKNLITVSLLCWCCLENCLSSDVELQLFQFKHWCHNIYRHIQDKIAPWLQGLPEMSQPFLLCKMSPPSFFMCFVPYILFSVSLGLLPPLSEGRPAKSYSDLEEMKPWTMPSLSTARKDYSMLL